MDNLQRKFDFEINEHTAYIIGVYITDGYILKNQFYLETIDLDFCETIIEEFKCVVSGVNENIRHIESRVKGDGYNYQPTYKVKITSGLFCKWIMDITDKKQKLPDEILNHPNRSIQLALLAGLMDGDGWVTKQKIHKNPKTSSYGIGLCGYEIIYNAVKDYQILLDKLGIINSKIYSNQKPGFVKYTIRNFSFVQQGGYFKLKRKIQRLEEMKTLFDSMPTCSKNKILNGIRSTTPMTDIELSM